MMRRIDNWCVYASSWQERCLRRILKMTICVLRGSGLQDLHFQRASVMAAAGKLANTIVAMP